MIDRPYITICRSLTERQSGQTGQEVNFSGIMRPLHCQSPSPGLAAGLFCVWAGTRSTSRHCPLFHAPLSGQIGSDKRGFIHQLHTTLISKYLDMGAHGGWSVTGR